MPTACSSKRVFGLFLPIVAALVLGFSSLSSFAQDIPTTINYQGRLLLNGAQQEAASGPVDIVFSIWSGPTGDAGATQLWAESWTGVPLSNGIFSVMLGSNGSPLDPAVFQGDSTLFLEIQVSGETMTPRQALGSAPFAVVDEPSNELQTLDLTGTTLSISGSGSSVDLGVFTDTDDQDLSLDAGTNILSLTDDPTPVDLSAYLDNTDQQDLSLDGTTNLLGLTGDATPVDLTPYLDNTDSQNLSLTGDTLSLTGSSSSADLSVYRDNTDHQSLSLSGSTLSISGSGSSVNLSGLAGSDSQTLGLSGNTLSISGGNSVNLASYLDNTDSQNLSNVLTQGNDAGNRDIANLDNLDANSLTCPDCIGTGHISNDAVLGNDVTDRIFILHIDCNGSCANMSMRDACNVIENQRGLTVETELVAVSCTHNVPSTTGNGFVECDDGTEVFSGYECRAFELRTLGDIPCVNGDGTDALVTCWITDIAK